MNKYEFYKSALDRELSRRNDLDNAVNTPITGLSIIIGLNYSFAIPPPPISSWDTFLWINAVLLGITVLLIFFALLCVFKTVNNFLKGFDYNVFGNLSEYRKEETKFPDYPNLFEEAIIDKIVALRDNNSDINIKRANALHKARTLTILATIFTFINLIINIIKTFLL